MMKIMSLTADDLKAIRELIDTRIPPIISSESDRVSQMTAAAFAEVHSRIDVIENTMEFMGGQHQQMNDALVRIELRQNSEIDRVDQHSLALARLNRELGLQ